MSARLSPVVLLLVSLAAAQASEKPETGYLPPAQAIDSTAFLPPPPAAGTAQFASDLDVYTRMRALQGSPRWALARNDDNLAIDAILKDFSCALGIEIDGKTAPKLAALFKKAWRDAGNAIGTGKKFYNRPRPLVGNDLPICVDRADYAHSASYPSGHTTLSWTFTLILAELFPDRAAAIAMRGRAFGESRAVCGVHWASDVEAGRTAGAAVFAALQGNAAFRRDLEAVRKEVARLRPTAPKPNAGSCAALEPLLKRPW